MAKNVKKLHGASEKELAALVTTRKSLLETIEENRAAHEEYENAVKQLKNTDKSILSLMSEMKAKVIRVLGYILTLIESAVAPKNVVIGVNELQEELAARGLQAELDLIEDIISEMKAEKAEKNAKEAASKVNLSLDVEVDEQRAIG